MYKSRPASKLIARPEGGEPPVLSVARGKGAPVKRSALILSSLLQPRFLSQNLRFVRIFAVGGL